MTSGKIYRVGIYCRLSKEDAINPAKKNFLPADESVSIENQKDMLSKFAMLNGWVEAKTYTDDWYSGGNFNRPGFQSMLRDVKDDVINLVLVKDLSRLGRDYVEVGYYTGVVFPQYGCRFVSMLDLLDSESDNTDMLHFRSLMNDYHLKDLSEKIKSVLRSKKSQGQYTGAIAPYGYRKSEEKRNSLIPDEYAAGIVRRIFDLRRDEMSYRKIAGKLNEGNVPSPKAGVWTDTMVKIILRNEVYIGNMVQGKTGTLSYKSRKLIAKPKEEWIRVENTHEPIISRDVWDTVQKINENARSRCKSSDSHTPKLFAGKVFCSDCGSALAASTDNKKRKNSAVKKYVYYHCGRYSHSGTVCSSHTIYEKTLSLIVLSEIKRQAELSPIDKESAAKRLHKAAYSEANGKAAEIRSKTRVLQRRLSELDSLLAELYEDKVSGGITNETFSLLTAKMESERLEKSEKLSQLCSDERNAMERVRSIQNWTELIERYADIQELSRDAVEELVERIEVGERFVVNGTATREVKIHFRFLGSVIVNA